MTLPKYHNRGMYLTARGLHMLDRILTKKSVKTKVINAIKKAVHGLSIMYGFKPRDFMEDNFTEQSRQLYFRGTRCNVTLGSVLINQLISQLGKIHTYSSISEIRRSKYGKYIRIYGVSKYYHPRKIHYAQDMRDKLSKLSNKRCRFTGQYVRFGHKKNGQTVLVVNVRYHHQLMTDHVWMTATKPFREIRSDLPPYATIAFNARVKRYQKGQISKDFYKHVDYSLALPTKITIIKGE